MPSLLSQVLDSKDNPAADFILSPKDDTAHKLPDGSVVYDSTISAINRVFELNPFFHKRVNGREQHLYNRNKKVDLKKPLEILSLLRSDWEPKTDWQLAFFIEKVTELAPILSFDCYNVTDCLLWDKNTATLRRVSPREMMAKPNNCDNIRSNDEQRKRKTSEAQRLPSEVGGSR